jgi:hypothetical protein
MTRLCDKYEVFYLMRIDSDEEEVQVRTLLAQSQLDKDKVIFCEHAESKLHVVRQLEPSVHIEGDDRLGMDLARYVPLVINVSRSQLDDPSNVAVHNKPIHPPVNVQTVPRLTMELLADIF